MAGDSAQQVAPLYAGSMGHGWLCFEGESEKRRLPDPPSGWGEWPDEALERLCRAAEPARPRAAPVPLP